MIFCPKLANWRVILLAALLYSPVLTACHAREAKKTSEFIPVAIHGVNYTEDEVGFVLVDPANRNNRGGGETINPYSAGGTMCCFALPRKWRPGLQVEVIEIYWVTMPNGTMPQRQRTHVVDLPAYGGGKLGELWVIRAPDGAVSVVSSDLQPDHPKWPGAIKGWPVPSIEYQRKIQDIYIHHKQLDVDGYIRSIKDLDRDPKSHAQAMWEVTMRWQSDDLKPYRGANDPAYLASLRNEYTEGLARTRQQLAEMKAARP